MDCEAMNWSIFFSIRTWSIRKRFNAIMLDMKGFPAMRQVKWTRFRGHSDLIACCGQTLL